MNDLITNGTEIKQRIISEINKAEQSICIAMAYFTDRDIASAIIKAKQRDLKIDVILSSNSQNQSVKLILEGEDIKVHSFEVDDARGIMHHKFCLIDGKISINGSYNYSLNASNNNVENIQVSDDIATYTQFSNEFDRLMHDISQSIGEVGQKTDGYVKTRKSEPQNIVNAFSEQLQNLVYSSAQIDNEKYRQQGFEASKLSKGSIEIFNTKYDNVKEEIRAYTTNDNMGSVKNTLSSNISNAYVSAKTRIELERQDRINSEKRKSELEKSQVKVKYDNLNEAKILLESGNQSTGQKGLFQINKEIDKNRLERDTLDQSLIIRKFWNLETVLILLGFVIFSFYLSLFFASGMYKMFFEEINLRASLEAGLNPGLPQILDANALVKIFNQQGPLFGFLASIFFLFPVLLSNLKIIGSEKKRLNMLFFGVGIVIFDFIVAIMVTVNIDEMKSLLIGKESTLQIYDVYKHGEFWMMFVFGMFPLIIYHFIIENLSKNYKNSRREIVSAEKNKKIQNLDAAAIDLQSEKKMLSDRLSENEDLLKVNCNMTLNLEKLLNSLQTQIENDCNILLRQIKEIFDDFNTKVISGRIFTDVILNSVTSAFKSGFIEYLSQYYAEDEVTKRVKAIEQLSLRTIQNQ